MRGLHHSLVSEHTSAAFGKPRWASGRTTCLFRTLRRIGVAHRAVVPPASQCPCCRIARQRVTLPAAEWSPVAGQPASPSALCACAHVGTLGTALLQNGQALEPPQVVCPGAGAACRVVCARRITESQLRGGRATVACASTARVPVFSHTLGNTRNLKRVKSPADRVALALALSSGSTAATRCEP